MINPVSNGFRRNQHMRCILYYYTTSLAVSPSCGRRRTAIIAVGPFSPHLGAGALLSQQWTRF